MAARRKAVAAIILEGKLVTATNQGRARHSVRAADWQPMLSAGRGLPALPAVLALVVAGQFCSLACHQNNPAFYCLHAARVLLKANGLQLVKRHFSTHCRAGITLSLAVFVLVLNAMAAFPALHELIHQDANSTQHHCAVTLFAHGQVDSATVEVAPVTPTALIEFAPQFTFPVFAPAIENLPAGRAPPAAFSSIV